VGRLQCAQAARELRQRLVRLERDHLREVGVVGHEGRHRPFRDENQLGIGVAATQRPHEAGW